MNKILVVARNEYFIAITSKAFLIGVIMMPVFMGGAIVVQYLTRDQVDLSPRKIAIVDPTGRLIDKIQQRAEARNENEIYSGEGDSRKQTQAAFHVEAYDDSGDSQQRADVVLTERVKQGDLFAFALIDPGVFDASKGGVIRYHSETPSYQTLANWLRDVVNDEIKQARITELNLSPESVMALSVRTPVRQFGLVEKSADGQVKDAKEENRILTFAVPFAGLMLMFMMIMSVAPAMLNNVLEEKMQKISEFLVSSITPFQLMAGKLLGAVAVGVTLSLIYLSATYGLASYYGFSSSVPASLYGWFLFYLLTGLVIFGSMFSAIGAACSEIRDAQSLMTPVMLLVIIPMMCLGPVLDSPNSLFARAVSMFPPATPMLMFARIAIPPGPATWEIVVATVLVLLFAVGCVWAAGKVFRVGVLSQGQSPSFAKLAKWVFSES